MFRCLFRLLVLGALAIVAIIFLTPRFLQQAGNSLITNLNNSAASGLAQYIPSNFTDSNSHLQVSVSGLSPNSQYRVTLDSTTCEGSPSMNIGLATTDTSGSINQEFIVSSLDTSQSWFVVVHQGNDPSGTILACGQLSNNGSSIAVVSTPLISLSPLPSGQTPGTTNVVGPTPTPETGFPNTGVEPGSKNFYDNNVYPRKY